MKLIRYFAGRNAPEVDAAEESAIAVHGTKAEIPLRAELFGIEQLEHHAKAMAATHRVKIRSGPDRLLPRLDENEAVLRRAYELIADVAPDSRRITPAAEWLLDNFYLIEEHIRKARRHLPKGYSRELPRLSDDQKARCPRVYDIAIELISHVDGSAREDSLVGFITAYQSVQALNLGELWAIPIMLRLALVENLGRVAARLAAETIDRNEADLWADRMIATADSNPSQVIIIVGDLARSDPSMSIAFVAELARRLQGQIPSLALPLGWIEQRLSNSGTSIEEMTRADSRRQAADQVSVRNSLGGLRFIGVMEWRAFVEKMSTVEGILRGDPSGVYANMDFATRDQYRHVVERTARHGRLGEEAVARRAVELASAALIHSEIDAAPPPREAHVGFYLIGEGLTALERDARVRPSFSSVLCKFGRRFALFCYLASIAVLSGAVVYGVLRGAGGFGLNRLSFVFMAILVTSGAVHLAVSLVNWLATIIVSPRPLPKMDYSRAIPAERRTLVVIPTILHDARECDTLIEGLEVRFLSNRDPNLWFSLLTDFSDSSEAVDPADADLLDRARSGIERLNERYRGQGGKPFLLLHRPRRWNPREGLWIGWERKRGKLADLNALLRGRGGDRFSMVIGDSTILPTIKYVITLDTDTQLPRDSARRLVGAISHPLNQPKFDPQTRRIREGYAILQPRVAVCLPGANRSWYVRLFAGDAGVDPYTRTVSDVYQDVFREGSFIGKGIYDVDAFEEAVGGRLPENRILSHDLLEGCHARSALISDVQLYERFPSLYSADVSRRHRWIRGDWQIFPWLLPRVPCAGTQWEVNPLSALSRWKIMDNLRRSLVPPALTLLLLFGWMTPGLGWFWIAFVASVTLLPWALESMLGLWRKDPDIPIGVHLNTAGRSSAARLAPGLFTLVFLPYDAYYSLDAIIRTWARVLHSGRRLLEWRTSRDAESAEKVGILGFYRTMWIAPCVAASALVYLALARVAEIAFAVPLLWLWLASPWIAWWLSRAIPLESSQLNPDQAAFLGKIARKTWRYFETFAVAEDHWLPPDNYQEFPVEAVAHRTSPTNIGLSLLADLAAYDFGYISAGGTMARTSRVFATMRRLERHSGHFYNWYDTRKLVPLHPRYVSTVDSGNLAGYLLTLRAGLLDLPDHGILSPRAIPSLCDTLHILSDLDWGKRTNGTSVAIHPPSQIKSMLALVTSAPAGLSASRLLLRRLAAAADGLRGTLSEQFDEEIIAWIEAFEAQCEGHLEEIRLLAPWTELSPLLDLTAGQQLPEYSDRCCKLRELSQHLDAVPTLRSIVNLESTLLPLLGEIMEGGNGGLESVSGERTWFAGLRKSLRAAACSAKERIATLQRLASECGDFAEWEYDLLYDDARKLMSIGFNVDERRRDAGFYDLLASEARVGSFIGIAQGRIPQEHWFALGRLLTASRGRPALLSWGGSMFEYLMPLLILPTYRDTLLDETCDAAVDRQIKYGNERGVPWGMSESGYNVTDVNLNYQYRAFGTPGLGLKRGLGDDIVVAPYATVLALMRRPVAGYRNLVRLARLGAEGRYGYYEAVDYTAIRLPPGEDKAIVRSFMAHHQGMSLLALASVLLDHPMQRRLASDPLFQATELLLQEKVPQAAPFFPHAAEVNAARGKREVEDAAVRIYATPGTTSPEVHLLSNGRYSVMITNSGGGYSRWKDIALTRWNGDTTRDHWGMYCYLRDMTSGAFWSSTYQPVCDSAAEFEAIFPFDRAEFICNTGEIQTHSEIAVSPEDDIELRRVSLTNRSGVVRTIELTSYAEVALASPADDAAHPAFGKLFVETEIVRPWHAILCTRRPRSSGERPPWMFHLMSVGAADAPEPTYETDRLRFLGRGRTSEDPLAMNLAGKLSGGERATLDPIVAIRRTVGIEPGETTIVDIVTGAAETREGAMVLVEKYAHDRAMGDRVFGLAWTHNRALLSQLNASDADAQIYERLAGSVVYPSPLRRADPGVLIRNRRQQSALWGYGISGDLPIVLARISDASSLNLVRQLIQAHTYWRLKGLTVDLVILNDEHSDYRQTLHDHVMDLIASGPEAGTLDRPGGIFVRSNDRIPEADRILIESVAHAILVDTAGTLAEQVEHRVHPQLLTPAMLPLRIPRPGECEPGFDSHFTVPVFRQPAVPARTRTDARCEAVAEGNELILFNGLGGFTRDGREYVIHLKPEMATPMPWSNILANADFGTVLSESGGAYTWSENAHEFRLTPWHNDPVSDVSGEALYIRDEETGFFHSPTPLPARGSTPYTTRHGFGYTVFEHTEDGVTSELWVYIAIDASVKFSLLKIRNHSGRSRRLSATGFVEWTLGQMRSKMAAHVVTEIDPECGAMFARNHYNNEFPERVAFFNLDEPSRTFTGDRTEFLGRNGGFTGPDAMTRVSLSGRVGAGLDPCAAMQVKFDLAPGEERELVFSLGAARNTDDARALVQRFRGIAPAHQAREAVWEFWGKSLGIVHLETPDPATNVLANGWLLYQAWACRMWGRSGYYQSGGAYGFRDQLQDSLALMYSSPLLVREHLLRCAGRQFREGDVAHWWHPPIGRGVRTRFSDDFLWLPWVTARYVAMSGDTGVLDEPVQYITGRPLGPDEESYYDFLNPSSDTASLYDHCVLAITHGLQFGIHGLPLMGGGDWNDGMNVVGAKGRGESVWLAFFLHDVLRQFGRIAGRRGDKVFEERCGRESAQLRKNIEISGWDGEWYRRAYFDNGEPLGSAANSECRIDSVPQSWAVLSGACEPARARAAMASVDRYLIHRDTRLVRLLDPPFDKFPMDPGYIKGYPPGVRENGGQYNHAAIWTAMAFAELGDTARMWDVYQMINPAVLGATPQKIDVYRVEPYVVAADISSSPPHAGQGGWTWYTGSAAWMYRLIVESIVGLRLEADRLAFTPRFPAEWESITVHYRHGGAIWHIHFTRTGTGSSVARVTVDGVEQPDKTIPLIDEGMEHSAEVVLY